MTADEFTFTPDTIRVKKGDRVRIHLTSLDNGHGIGMQGYTQHIEVGAGQTKTLEFVADKSGNFTFYCNVFCGSGHRDMKGMLIVE
jgi:heme/copper-type cytochrome/quinol oxidase subunit 2